MEAMSVAQSITAEEFLELPEPHDARRVELVAGEVVMHHPSLLHEVAQRSLHFALHVWTEAGEGRGRVHGPIDSRLDAANVFAPDVLWYSAERAPDIRSLRPYPLSDLVIEVRSPSTWRYDIGAKKSAYERHGLPELWLVDTTAEQVLVFRRSTPAQVSFDVALELCRGEPLGSPLLPGFSLALDELFDID